MKSAETENHVRSRALKRAAQGLVVVLSAISFCIPVWGDYRPSTLPDLGDPADTALSPARAKQLGKEAFDSFRSHDYVEDDPELSTYIRQLGHRLAEHTDRNPSFFHYFVVRDSTINSFALPGGYIAIQTGLIAATHSVSELAAVMSHETGHEVQNHIARRMQEQHVLNWETGAAIVAAILAGGASPDAVIGGLGVGAASYYQRSVSFTRGEEFEADRVGIRILAASGFNPYGMVSFFQRLEQQSRLSETEIPPILQDHPVDSVRIAEAESRAAQYPKRNLPPNLEYHLMRARDEVLSADEPQDVVGLFRQRHSDHPGDVSATYGYALALERAGKDDRARPIMQALAKQSPDQVHYQLALAEMALNAHHGKAAVSRLAGLMKTHSNYEPVILDYAAALVQTNQPEQARNVLLSTSNQLQQQPRTQQLLAQAAAQQGRQGEAYYDHARYYELEGDTDAAIKQLRYALRLPNLSADDTARFQAKLNQLKREKKEKKQ